MPKILYSFIQRSVFKFFTFYLLHVFSTTFFLSKLFRSIKFNCVFIISNSAERCQHSSSWTAIFMVKRLRENPEHSWLAKNAYLFVIIISLQKSRTNWYPSNTYLSYCELNKRLFNAYLLISGVICSVSTKH